MCEDWATSVATTAGERTPTNVAMSDAHKEALALGRREARTIKAYLEATKRTRRPGRPVRPETLEKRLVSIEEQLGAERDPLKRVELQQRKLDVGEQLAELADVADMEELEQGFVEAVAGYSERKGISYAAWRAEGVPAAVLRRAGIRRNG